MQALYLPENVNFYYRSNTRMRERERKIIYYIFGNKYCIIESDREGENNKREKERVAFIIIMVNDDLEFEMKIFTINNLFRARSKLRN